VTGCTAAMDQYTESACAGFLPNTGAQLGVLVIFGLLAVGGGLLARKAGRNDGPR